MANGTRAFALSGSNLVSFDPANPSIGTSTAITGVTAGETLVGIDFRPQNGMLYGLGVNPTADTATLYAISTRTGVAAVVGTSGGIAFADLPDPATTGYGLDFNPTVDRIRITTDDGLNFRVNPNTGTVAAVDGAINGLPAGATGISATAYTNNQPNSTVTTLYTLDATTNSLFIQNPPNNGTQTNAQVVTLNGSPLDFTSVNGFDLQAGIDVASNNAPASGSALAALTVGGVTSLYSINLVDATATLLGPVLNGAAPVSGLAIQNDFGGIPALALSADGTNLLRFNTATTGTATTLAVTGVVPGEQLVGIDFRPQTGQLYALGVNATADTATVYLVDPQGGGLTVVGAPSQISFDAGGGTLVDLPNPATTGYGFDFNPTVDRIRVTTDTGLNFRVNPNNGAPVDGDAGSAGIQPDGSINGLPAGATGVSAAAYTNSFGQTGSTATTLYTLDPTTNTLFIQNPANSGTQTSGLAVTLNGGPLDFTGVSGFDIPAGVSVAAANAPATGFGYAALTVAGATGLYQIDLATGVATNLGAIGFGGSLAGLALSGMPFTPAITSNGGGRTASVSVAENGTAVTTVMAADGDGNALTFAIVGGADAAAFVIDAATGALAFAASPDFEAPTDADQNNSYDVVVQASDGMLTDSQALSVGVADVDGVTIVGTKGKDVVDADSTVAGQPLPTGEEDLIQGGKGNDKLDGGAGDDRLEGDRGKNKLTGGLGDDAFVFDEKLGKGKDGGGNNSSYAKITDFGVGDDGFELSNAVFKKLELGVLSDDAFRDIGEKATNDTRVTYRSNGELSYDKDGKGGADAVVFAKVDKGLDLSVADFLIV